VYTELSLKSDCGITLWSVSSDFVKALMDGHFKSVLYIPTLQVPID